MKNWIELKPGEVPNLGDDFFIIRVEFEDEFPASWEQAQVLDGQLASALHHSDGLPAFKVTHYMTGPDPDAI